jgi:transposase-like protein
MMSSKKRIGLKLLKNGYSYNEIKSKLNVAKSTLNNWFSQLSEKEKNKIKGLRIDNWRKSIKEYQRKKRQQTLKKEKVIQKIAAKEIKSLSKNDLLLVGISLYWAEGSKNNRWQLQFSNSDPKMIRLMIRFFQEICGVGKNKFYLQMILHKNVKKNEALDYWAGITKINKEQFKKACYSLSKSSKKIRSKNKLPFGTLQIRILDKRLTHRVYGYIKGLKQAGIV